MTPTDYMFDHRVSFERYDGFISKAGSDLRGKVLGVKHRLVKISYVGNARNEIVTSQLALDKSHHQKVAIFPHPPLETMGKPFKVREPASTEALNSAACHFVQPAQVCGRV